MLRVSNSNIYTSYSQHRDIVNSELKRSLEKLIVRCENELENHLNELKDWFDNQDCKDGIKSILLTKNWSEFETVWDGVRALLKHLDQELDLRVKKADLELLIQDLRQLQNIFN